MHLSHKTRLATGILLTALLAGCGSDVDSTSSGSSSGSSSSGSSSSGGSSSGGSSSGGTSSALLLDPVQDQLSGVLATLGTSVQTHTPAGTPLDIGGFILALDPTLNELVIGPSSTLTGLLDGVRTILANPSPSGFQTAAGQIQTGIEALPPAVSSLAQNLPCALGTLIGQRASVCGSSNPAAQLQQLIALFQGGQNPFAGTPLAALGSIGAPGTPGGGPTGTPLDQILTPLQTLLGVPASGGTPAIPAAPLDNLRLAALGDGLSLVGDAIVDGYNNVPGATSLPLAGELVLTLGNTLSDLGTTLGGLTPTSGSTTGTAIAQSLLDLSNVLSAPTGLLGTLALIGGDTNAFSTITSGNTQLNNGLTQLTGILESSIRQPSGSSLTNSLTSLGNLTCALSILNTCSGTGSSAASNLTGLGATLNTLLGSSLGSMPGGSLITTVVSTLGTASTDNSNLLTGLTSNIQTVVSGVTSGGSTGLLGSGTTSGSGSGGLLGGLLGLLGLN